ncbi:MAG: restriction endonuclease [Candidatus Syntrophopropionicum ammoniitolerans]
MDEIKLHPQQGFAAPVKDLLGNLPGFAQLNLRHGEDKKARWNEQIDIKGLFKGAPVGIKCLYQEGEQPVTPLAVSSFFNALDDAGLKNGLFITSGDFAAGVAQVTRQATRAGIKIMLVNRYGLIDLARRAGIGVFGEEDHGLGKTKSENHRRLDAFIDTVFDSRKKVRNYFWCGLLLYGGYLLLKDTTSFSLIYLVFAVINLLLGGSLLFSRTLGQADPLTALELRK